jgi:hypothetical protein
VEPLPAEFDESIEIVCPNNGHVVFHKAFMLNANTELDQPQNGLGLRQTFVRRRPRRIRSRARMMVSGDESCRISSEWWKYLIENPGKPIPRPCYIHK